MRKKTKKEALKEVEEQFEGIDIKKPKIIEPGPKEQENNAIYKPRRLLGYWEKRRGEAV